MPAPVSIIIPTLNSANTLGPMMAGLFEGMSAGLVCEVIFADGGSSDDTIKIGDELGVNIISCPKGRGTQMAAGANAARGEWLFFVHSDTRLSTGWADVVLQHVQTNSKAGFGKLQFDASGFGASFVAGWANIRSRLFGLPYGDQTLLISKAMYRSTGGFRDIPLMEDVAMSNKIGRQKTALKFTATTNADRFVNDGWFRRGTKNIGTLVLYYLGRDPKLLSHRYHR
ncbi:glycosyl transferase [Amylibacter ulvae]|uniref:Glycosyl transferase n=1 Tax=Paramylibacter ulvae TaxID=1651968 RepID=A0ABQ3D9X5_9RHOB|nr:TIGR04283 family arsenosugar biosynthesis glycosyltransferase [Amylibacter ulvae]GHA60436.1 glycosyl transferase [Amylibacter ulvae]